LPPGSPAGARRDGPGLKGHLRILYRRRALILGCVLAITAVTALVAHQRVPWYTATAQVLIHPGEARIVKHPVVIERLERDAASLETEIKRIRSRSHGRLVVDRLDLVGVAGTSPAWRAERGSLLTTVASGPLRWLVERLPSTWLIASGLAHQQSEGALPLPELPPSGEELRERVVDAYLARLAVGQDGRSYILDIGFTSPDPREAARIANATADIYVEAQAEARRRVTSRAHGWLDERVEELRRQVEEAERTIARFRAEHDLVGAGGGSLGDSQLADLNRQLLSAQAERAEREAKLRLARTVRARGEGFEAVTEVLTSPVVQALRREEASLIREEAQLSLELGERHPRIVQLRAEIGNIQGKVDAEMRNIVRNLENEVAVVRSREQALERSLDRARGASAETRQVEVQLRELERHAANTRALYETYLGRLTEVREQERLIEPGAQVITDARVPPAPSTIGAGRVTAGGFGLSLLLGVALALLAERLDGGVRSARQVEELLGLPCLGLVPKVKGAGRGDSLPHLLELRPLSAYAEGVRVALTGLQLADVDAPPRVVTVTSSLPGEGKTTLAASLAAAAARAGRSAILVDLDLRRPVVHTHLAGAPSSGVVELMAGEATLEEAVVVDLLMPDLHFLPVCRGTASPFELIGSRKMHTLIAELRRRYDLVVIDTTPAIGISDARVAARLADKVLFVVQWERTNEEVAASGLDALEDARADIAGVVLTQVDLRRHARYAYGDVGNYYSRYKRHYVD
jgi:polysaccharide biosynthesis transport protein